MVNVDVNAAYGLSSVFFVSITEQYQLNGQHLYIVFENCVANSNATCVNGTVAGFAR